MITNYTIETFRVATPVWSVFLMIRRDEYDKFGRFDHYIIVSRDTFSATVIQSEVFLYTFLCEWSSI